MMHDNGDRTEALLAMWSRVKGDNANTVTYVIIAIALLVLVLALVLSRRKKHHGRYSRRRR